MSDVQLTRNAIAEIYAGMSDATVRMQDYYSARCFEFEVVEEDATYGVAWAKAVKGEVVFYDYAIGSRIQRGANASFKANRAQTNLVRAHSTNGAADMAIERIGLQPLLVFAAYGAEVNLDSNFGVADADITKALHGEGALYDPSSLVTPAQANSPFFVSATALWEALDKVSSIQLGFDGKRRDLAPAFQVGQLGASSYARSHGEIGGESAWETEEGYHWAKDGQQDSDFSLIVTVEEGIIVPLSLPTQVNAGTGYQRAPTKIWVEVCATVRGPEYSTMSYNQ